MFFSKESRNWIAGLAPGAIAKQRGWLVPGRTPARRFMESLLSLLRMHGDHEPWKAPASRTHSKRFAKSKALGHCAAAFGVRGACSRFRRRFMESPHAIGSAHCDHEPIAGRA